MALYNEVEVIEHRAQITILLAKRRIDEELANVPRHPGAPRKLFSPMRIILGVRRPASPETHARATASWPRSRRAPSRPCPLPPLDRAHRAKEAGAPPRTADKRVEALRITVREPHAG